MWPFSRTPSAPSPGKRDPLGPAGERVAARSLRRAGYRVLGRNVHAGPGEADLVCRDPDGRTIVIVEVKSRRREPGSSQPPPEAAIHARKRKKLQQVARAVLASNGWTGLPMRIDVVAVDWPPSRKQPEVRHFVNAVRG